MQKVLLGTMLTSGQSAKPTRRLPFGLRGAPSAHRPSAGLRRARRVALVAAAIALIPTPASYASARLQRADSALGVRTVEWIRDNGARSFVNSIENFYYTLTAPSKGGPALKKLPQQAGAVASRGATHHKVTYYRPPRIKPIIHRALPGEGVWHATFARAGARPPVLITTFRPEPAYPRLVAGVAWIDHSVTSTMLYPGLQEPSVTMPNRGPMEVPRNMRSDLVATFNSGFKLADAAGGFAYRNHTYRPMRDGMATFVRYRNGAVNVLDWNRGPVVGPDVVYARQNLPLIVKNARPNPNLNSGPEWGFTVGNTVLVWRSAVGVDRHGNLLYAAANDLTVSALARIMIHAGAVRAMELDINAYWPSFITYRNPGAGHPANLLPDMVRSPYRYLTQDDRDFFAVYLRRPTSSSLVLPGVRR